MALIIKLPFPDSRLMPNRKNGKHWTSTVEVKNGQKTEAAICTKQALRLAGPQNYGQESIPLSLLFLCPDKRHRDIDNLLAAAKPIIDAVAQELGVNDRQFKPVLLDSALGPKGGALIAAVGVSIVSGVAFDVEQE